MRSLSEAFTAAVVLLIAYVPETTTMLLPDIYK